MVFAARNAAEANCEETAIYSEILTEMRGEGGDLRRVRDGGR
jgi:hypothetical protein